MLAELLLVLGGHPSVLITAEGVAPSLAEHLHPGEVAALNTLATLAANYRAIRSWAEDTQAAARAAVLAQGSKRGGSSGNDGAVPGLYVAVLAGAVCGVLAEYDELLVETEASVLGGDAGVVQHDAEGGYVPLSLLVATFDSWQAPMGALAALAARVRDDKETYAPGALLDHLSACAATGDPTLLRIFSTLRNALWRLFLSHLVVFLLDGVAPASSTPAAPAIGLDAGADAHHRGYRLDAAVLPSSVRPSTRESILYVGRVAATLKRQGRALPRSLTDSLRADVLAASYDGLDGAVQRARADIGEWLWTHILTGPQVAGAIESFANYFLTRDADFALNVLREIARLRSDRLVLADPTSSSSVIRAHDLDLALLRASVGTAAESDRALEALSWWLPGGPLRAAYATAAPEDDGSVRALFASALLGAPVALTTDVSWPLDLFMTPPAVAAYTDMHAYLYAIRDTHMRVLDSWGALSAAQRRRRVYTGTDEGGSGAERATRTQLQRTAWATVRAMLFFLDQLLDHFMTDIIGVQHKRLLGQLARAAPDAGARGGTPGPGATPRPASARSASPARGAHYLDFLTLRQMHARHVAFLREGLLISDRERAVLVRDILDVCKRFAGLVERWGGDVLPQLLDTAHADVLTERSAAVDEINETLHDLIGDFFRMLLDSQAPLAPASDVSGSGGSTSMSATSRTGVSRASMSRARVTQMMVASRSRGRGADDGDDTMGRHVEQLLLRLDFNGVLTAWQEGRVQKTLLPPEGF